MRYEDVPKLTTWKQDSAVFASVGSTGRVAAIKNAWGPQGAVAAASTAPGSRAGLAQIDAQIQTYATAFSPMAKTNVLNDLRKAIEAWHQTHPGALPVAMAALKETVDNKLKLRPGNSRYTKAICIAFHAGCNYDKTLGTTHASSVLNKDYFRHSENDQLDMETKCARLWAGIQSANAAIPVQGLANDNKTLKIFMAPEFFFRGKNGAYSPEVVSKIIPRMRMLGTSNGIYQDWMFVFGTAVAAFEDSITVCAVCPRGSSTITFERNVSAPNPADRAKTVAKCSTNAAHATTSATFGAEVQNVALIQHGADDHMVAKEYVSGIDYKGDKVTVRPGAPDQATLDVLSPLGSEDRPGGMAVQSDERLGGCIFTVDGLTIGLEVCLDHSLAPQGAAEFGRASALKASIQILLIPSYGMSIDGMHCKANGIAFNVDGRVNGTSQVKLNSGGKAPQAAKVVGTTLSLYGPFNIPA